MQVDNTRTDNKKQNAFEIQKGEPASVISAKLTKMDNSNKIRKSKKKGVFLSYAPNAPYEEKKFVVELSKQLYEIGLNDDVWFDRDFLQGDINSPFLTSSRLEVAEKCKAAIVVLSESFFLSSQTRAEAEILLDRASSFEDSSTPSKKVVLLTVKLGNWDGILEDALAPIKENISVNLSIGKISRLSEAEKVSMFISTLNQQLEDVSSSYSVRIPKTIDDTQGKSQFQTKPLVSWSVADVQDWLTSLKIHEKYIISFEEFEIDGFLLETLTDRILSDVLAVDSQICRRKILQKVKAIIDEELRTGRFNELLKHKYVRQRANVVYLITDPDDEQLGNVLRQDVERKGLKVLSHTKLGQSKDEFLRLNAHDIASSSHAIFLFTSKGCCSPFTFYEVVFSIWLGKPLIVAVFENCFDTTRRTLSAILSEFPTIDFATALYLDGLDLLLNEIKPQRAMSGVVFEQRYLKQVAEGVCQFKEIADRIQGMADSGSVSSTTVSTLTKFEPTPDTSKLFVSYQWDHQSKVKNIIRHLSAANISCWSDMDHVAQRPVTQSMPRATPIATSRMSTHDNLANEIERRIRFSNVVLLCVSPTYLQSSNCLKEVSIAASYNKPIIAILLQWLAWPPDSVSYAMRRIFATVKCTDVSNEKLLVRNLPSLVSQIARVNQI